MSADGNSSGWRADWPAVLLLGCIFLLPFSRLVEAPLALLAMGGVRIAWRRRGRLMRSASMRVLMLCFLAFWLPMLLAGMDAVNVHKTWTTNLAALRFLFAALGVLDCYAHRPMPRWFAAGLAAIVGFWLLDLAWQAALGTDWLGMPRAEERLNGIFGNHHYKLGPMLVLLLPPALAYLYGARHPRSAHGLLLAGFATVVAIGTRSAWLMAAVSTLAFLVMAPASMRRGQRRALGGLGVALLLSGAVVVWVSPYVQQRIAQSARVFEGTPSAADAALTLRLPIWQTAWNMARKHPINGVGPRGFRYAYAQYAPADDPWVANPEWIGAFHPHQIVLEVLSETGVIGLFGLAMLLWLLTRRFLHTPPENRMAALPYAIALAALLFPLNTGYALYSSYWSIIVWWNITLFLALSRPHETLAQSGKTPLPPLDAS